MPHATIKLIPGVDTNKTPTLNEAAISYTDLVRFMPDRSGYGLVQKLGGWTRLIASSFTAPIRALKAWSDLEYTKYLAIGGEFDVGVQVYRQNDNSIIDITPRELIDNVASSAFTTSTALAEIISRSPVRVATVDNLDATYDNGTAGVGATLTNNGTLEEISIDGIALSSSDLVLVKNQSSGAQNGIYTVTTVGDGSTAWVLTRDTDFDSWGTGEIENGANFLVEEGDTNANKYYYCSNTSSVTVGTTAITFVQSLGFVTEKGTDLVYFYMPDIPSTSSYVFYPTIANVGNVNLVGPYDITSVGAGYLTFLVPDITLNIAKISATTSGSDRIVTIQFSEPHTFYPGQKIYVDGVTTTTFNGTFTISSSPGAVTTYTLQYTQTGVSTAANSYGGTVTGVVNFGGLTPKFTTSAGSVVVTVDLINHGFLVGDTFSIPVSTTVGGTTLLGLYTVSRVVSNDQFEIVVEIAASSTASAYENGGSIYTKTFVSIVSENQAPNYFYGGGIYGTGVYGSGFIPAVTTGTPIQASNWTFDNWGSILVSSPSGGALYYWQPIGGAIQNLSYMPNSPVYNEGFFVAMPQRQIVAYGSSFGNIQDPLLVRWCDLEDFTVWTGTANNQAGSYRIPTGSRIVGAIQAPQQSLVWTDLDVWSMSYIGQPYIYGFNKIGANAGLISKKAVSQMGGVIYWMSQKQFFKFSGNGVEVIPCPIWDQVFQNFYPGVDEYGNPYTDRIRCAANSQFNEIVWYFPAHYTNDINPTTGLALSSQLIGTGEVNAYAKYNVALNQWDYGYQHPDSSDVLIGRTSWIDQSVLGSPIGAASSSSSNLNNGVLVTDYFTAKNIYATGDSSEAKIYFTPISKTFVSGSSIVVSGMTDDKFNGVYSVGDSREGETNGVTISNASPAVITWNTHNLVADSLVYFTATETMPTGITAGTLYFVKTVLSENTFTISQTVGGAAVNTSSSYTGSITGTSPSYITMYNANFSATSSTDTSSGTIRYKISSYVYQHETSNNADGKPIACGFTTGYSSLMEGDKMIFIDQVWPDMKWGFVDEAKTAEVKITFYITNYPGDTPIQHGPYTVNQSTQYLSVRMRGRLVAMSVSSTDVDESGKQLPGSFWRIGAIRYRFQTDGKY